MVSRWSGLAQYLSPNQSVSAHKAQIHWAYIGYEPTPTNPFREKKLYINLKKYIFIIFFLFLAFVKEALDKDTLQNSKINK